MKAGSRCTKYVENATARANQLASPPSKKMIFVRRYALRRQLFDALYVHQQQLKKSSSCQHLKCMGLIMGKKMNFVKWTWPTHTPAPPKATK